MFERKGSRFVREGAPRTDNPFVPGTPDNVKAGLINYWDTYNRSWAAYLKYQQPVASITEPQE